MEFLLEKLDLDNCTEQENHKIECGSWGQGDEDYGNIC